MNGLTIYRSSAGSGKTYTLVKEYLIIALRYPLQFSKILGVTFTNKATAEMKNRVIDTLSDLSQGKKAALAQELSQFLPKEINIKEQAQIVLTNILHHYSNFSISTIDSFFNDIVKTLAHELKLSLRFEIELDTDKIIAESLDSMLAEVGRDKQLTEWLEEFLLFQIENDKGWSIRTGLIITARKLFDEEYDLASMLPDAETLKLITSDLKKNKKYFEATMKEKALKLKSIIEEKGYFIDDFSQTSKGIGAYIFRVAGTGRKQIDYTPNSYATAALTDSEKWLSKKKQDNVQLVDLIQHTLFPLASDLYQFYTENKVLYNSSSEVLKRIYIIGILTRLNEEIKKYRDEHSVITLNDANRIVRSSVTSADAPLIFEKTGSFFQHYLIDEFQDTSTVQWENIRPLITEALASNKSALLVGDIKQSIYRWRGGNMDLLHSVAEKQILANRSTVNSLVLDTNYRSTKEIIDFNNQFFSKASEWIQAMVPDGLSIVKEAYADDQLHQKTPALPPSNGYIKIRFYEKVNGDTADTITGWKHQSLDDMIVTINQLYEKGFSAGDITILVRSNFQGNMVASHLYENGIHNIISADSLLIRSAMQVNFLINCLELLINPKNKLIRKEAEWFLFMRTSTDDITHKVFSTNDSDLLATKMLNDFLSEYYLSAFIPVDDLITLIIKHFHLNNKPDAYIQRFQDLIAEYREKNPGDKETFLEWWKTDSAAANCSVLMPESQSAIRIMTIHKSKGLQFPVVIMPFADWELTPKANEILWAKPEDITPFNTMKLWPVSSSEALKETVFSEAYINSVNLNYVDNLNLLYVAFTRAVNHLYISTVQGSTKSVAALIQFVASSIQPDAENEFEFGEIHKYISKEATSEPSLFHPENKSLTDYPVFNWQNKMILRTEAGFKSKEIESGLLLHETLAFIHHEKNLEPALIKIRNIYNLSAPELTSLKKQLENLLLLCSEMKWFSDHYSIFTERDFITATGELLRPDRVMIKDQKAVIVDYKTGDELPAHKKQMESYAALLRDCGFPETETWILYTSSGKLLQC